MDIIAALFIDDIDLRPVDGGATHLDLKGVQFSGAAPEPLPFTWRPHLVVLVRCAADEPGNATLEVTFRMAGEEVARNVQPLQVEPGKFAFRLVHAELTFDEHTTVEAHCRVGDGPAVVVPYTMLAPDPS